MMFFKGKQKLIKILTAALVLLTAVSICIAGYTFARYSTSAGGTGTSAIALWNVNISPKTTTTTSGTYDGAVTFGKLSPGDSSTIPSEYSSTYTIYNKTSAIDLATVTYQTDVKVTLSIETSNFTINFNDGSSLVRTVTVDGNNVTTSFNDTFDTEIAYYVATQGTGTPNTASYIVTNSESVTYGSTNSSDTLGTWGSNVWTTASTYYPSYRDIAELFTFEISYSGSVDGSAVSGKFSDNEAKTGDLVTGHNYASSELAAAKKTSTIEITGSLVWGVKTPTSANTYWTTYLCDWVGKYVDSVSYTFTYSARQASEAGE